MTKQHDYLSTYVERYAEVELISVRNVSTHTYVSYLTTLKLYLLYLVSITGKHSSKLKSDTLTFETFHQFMIDSQSRFDWGPATWNLRLAGLRSFFEYMAQTDPKFLELYRRSKLIRSRTIPKSEPDYVTLPQLETVIDFRPKGWIEQRDRALIVLFFQSGFRISELVKIKEDDLDWSSSKSLSIRVLGKGRKKRRVPIVDKDTVAAIEYLIRSKNNHCSKYLFTTRDGGKQSLSNVRRIISKYFKKAFPNKKITPHSLRHSAAMNWLEGGMDIFTVCGILGHEDVSTTQRYARSRYEMKEKEMLRASKENTGYAKFKTEFSSNDALVESLNMKLAKARK